MHRKIIHIDMDAFYASVEQHDHPEYRGKPVIVGGFPEGRGGVVATASYEARVFSIRSAMPSKQALQLCPHAIFLRPRFDRYKQISQSIQAIFYRYTNLVEPLSLDEAYLDVTTDKLSIGSALQIAAQIKQSIKDELGLTASAGISTNKFVAKIASDMRKPDGLTFIGPSKVESFIEQLPVEKFYGVGKVTAARMKSLAIHNGTDLKKLSEQELVKHFGKAGHFYYYIVRGIDNRAVEPNRETKSIGAEDTFEDDLTEEAAMIKEIELIAVIVSRRLQQRGLKGKTITLKIKYSDFKCITRSHTFFTSFNGQDEIAAAAKKLLKGTKLENVKIRLLGITASGFEEQRENAGNPKAKAQLKLF